MFAKVEIIDNVKTIIPLTNKGITGDLPTLDAFYPIGYVYTQYPQQAAPSELFPIFTWTELNYDGAFFRAYGGNADAFISTGTLTPQGQTTAKNNLKVTKSGGISTGHVYDNDWSGSFTHTHAVYINDVYVGGDYNSYSVGGAYGPGNYTGYHFGRTSEDSWEHRHYYSFTPSVSDNISATITSSDTETRPTNYTIKIWARTA